MGNHGGRGGPVADRGSRGGPGGCGGREGCGQRHVGPRDKERHGKDGGGKGVGQQGGVHQGQREVLDGFYASRELSPAAALGYVTVTKEEWTICPIKHTGMSEWK